MTLPGTPKVPALGWALLACLQGQPGALWPGSAAALPAEPDRHPLCPSQLHYTRSPGPEAGLCTPPFKAVRKSTRTPAVQEIRGADRRAQTGLSSFHRFSLTCFSFPAFSTLGKRPLLPSGLSDAAPYFYLPSVIPGREAADPQICSVEPVCCLFDVCMRFHCLKVGNFTVLISTFFGETSRSGHPGPCRLWSAVGWSSAPLDGSCHPPHPTWPILPGLCFVPRAADLRMHANF